MQPEQPVLHLEKRTVRGHPADSLTRADSLTTLGGQFGKPTSTINPNPMDRNKAMQELAKNTMNI
jgi:hypothetical protein